MFRMADTCFFLHEAQNRQAGTEEDRDDVPADVGFISPPCLSVFVPDVRKLSDQDSHLHLDGGHVLQLDDLRDVRQGAVQPAGWRLLPDTHRFSVGA